MIFLTVGSALPFDRLVQMVDELAGEAPAHEEIFAQIGDGSYVPQHFPFARFLSHAEFEEAMQKASAVISHAGIGTITSALARDLPLLVLPRSPAYGELVDDHQEKTAQAYENMGHLLSFRNPGELRQRLRDLPAFKPRPRLPNARGVATAIADFMTDNFSIPKAHIDCPR